MQPYRAKGFRDMQREEHIRNYGDDGAQRVMTSELNNEYKKRGLAKFDCGTAARYEDGTCSTIAYDPAKMTFRERMEKQQHTRELLYPNQPTTEQSLTEAEKQATKYLKFTTLINPKPRARSIILPKGGEEL